ncbi:hypothetical protein SAMD00019534_083860 [Acytostelium subglobosum LB1]|uniref:hypothetical protein n=1 Tax=Acytostelium subglobosum LB1 TaxID=1410327 RepID=UPI0006449291|nr:hypothetical protein SAMD00019534_083860 [Acytostelium subglobosum LB1]GAM25211.1 hypothetical protein SAMD00019534_083860 [Acytostelium subglobosum LB1]|eukprot:XP_012751731.1 hypothetical protein SAMD00019534_083860 [Acytostelium subglobosum LB1]
MLLYSKVFCIPAKSRVKTEGVGLLTNTSSRIWFKVGPTLQVIKGEHRAFRPSEHNYKTHYDLTFAQELGLTFNLISDGKSINNLDTFYTPFARIMPFIISCGHQMIGTIIKDDIDCIKRVHTDGFVSTKPWTVKTGKLGKECGDLRYEGRQGQHLSMGQS